MKQLKGTIFALISSGTFGMIPLFSIPLLSEDIGTTSILFYRFLFSSLMMGLICLVRRESFKIPSRHLIAIFCLALFYAATALFLLYSYNFIPSGVATTIHFLYPILVSIIMVIFFKEKKSIILFIAALLSLAGVILLCWRGDGSIQITGVLMASLTIATYAIYIVGINQSKAGRLNAEILTFYILLFGAIIFFVAALVTTGIEPIPSQEALGRLLLLGLLCTVISDLTLIMAIKCVGSTITSILGSMEPLVAVAVGILYFSELFDINSFFGISLIILSVTLVVIKNAKSKDSLNPILAKEEGK